MLANFTSDIKTQTRRSMVSDVTSAVKELHSYSMPESIALDVNSEGSNAAYLDWVIQSTHKTK